MNEAFGFMNFKMHPENLKVDINTENMTNLSYEKAELEV